MDHQKTHSLSVANKTQSINFKTHFPLIRFDDSFWLDEFYKNLIIELRLGFRNKYLI